MKTKFLCTAAMTTVLLPVIMLAAPASAQTAASADGGIDGISEIVVTAQRRSQSLNDVGITITALPKDALEKRGVSSLADVASAVPTLQYTLSNNNTPIFTMRGVGFYESSLAAYPAISVSLDEVPLSLPALTTRTAFDLERIEVLKGPQGTLYGQNSTGGAINYVSAKPTDELSIGARASYGRFSRVNLDGYVSGPISDNIKARIALHSENDDGWQKLASTGKRYGKTEVYAGRALLEIKPSDQLTILYNVNGWKDQGEPQGAQFSGFNTPQAPGFVLPALSTLDSSPDNARVTDISPQYKRYTDNSLWQVSQRVDFDVTDAITLTSLTAYTDFKSDQRPDLDGTQYVIQDVRLSGFIKSFSQELRLANGSGTNVRWVGGVNFSRDHVLDVNRQNCTQMSLCRRQNIDDSGTSNEQVMKNYAAFGNVEYDLTKQFTIKAGVRYTKAERKADSCTGGFDGNRFSTFIANTSLALRRNILKDPTAAFIPIVDGQCWQMNDLFLPSFVPVRTSLSEDNVSWRVGADYKPVEDLLIYANVSKGYKAGSIPRSGATFIKQNQPVTQESVMAYEAGYKFTGWDRRLSLTGAVFYYNYRDKQLRNRIVDPVIGLLEILTNIPKSRVKGGEFELSVRPTRGLTMSVGASYTDGKVTKFTGVNYVGQVRNFAGTLMPLAPKYEEHASIDYTFPLSPTMSGFVGANVTNRSRTYSIIGGQDVVFAGKHTLELKGYAVLDLRAGVDIDNGKYSVSVFGKNVTNTYYWNNATTAFDVSTRYAGMPATYGITFGFKM